MKQQGVALLLVLWVVALLTALIGAFALTARVEALQGRVVSDGAAAQEIARAGVEYALVRVADTDPMTHWMPNGQEYAWTFADSELRIRITDESGKIDLNNASFELLIGLFQAVGVERRESERLAGAVVDWRDSDSLTQPSGGAEDADYAAAGLPYGAKDAPFETVAELELVLGMTPELYAKVEPSLTLYSGRSQPDPRYAPGDVLTAMGLDAKSVLSERERSMQATQNAGTVDSGSRTYSIESRVRLGNGREGGVRMVVNSRPRSPVPGLAYDILRREEGLVD
ncbi:MAG: general secretion pathway protein GspK [Xanthomonadaceae bacterium]|jgi:general secretion pathway protein K|nr:general secretion pathway protein GspK [Xanthomonadaceae bacterium]